MAEDDRFTFKRGAVGTLALFFLFFSIHHYGRYMYKQGGNDKRAMFKKAVMAGQAVKIDDVLITGAILLGPDGKRAMPRPESECEVCHMGKYR